MHRRETSEHLVDEVFDNLHRNGRLVLFSLAQLVFQAALGELHHGVLNDPLLLVHRVEEVVELDDVGCTLEQGEYLIFSADHVAGFLGSLDCNLHFFDGVVCFKYVTFWRENGQSSLNNYLPKAPFPMTLIGV